MITPNAFSPSPFYLLVWKSFTLPTGIKNESSVIVRVSSFSRREQVDGFGMVKSLDSDRIPRGNHKA